MIKKYAIFLLICASFTITSCKSPRFTERLGRLQTTANELNHSGIYWANMGAADLRTTREELVLLLLEEGEARLDVGERARAQFCFESVLELAGQKYSVNDLELNQSWRAMGWQWKECYHGKVFCGRNSCNRQFWQTWKAAFPGLWPYTIVETLVCFVADLIGGWQTEVEGIVTLPSLDALHISRARAGLRRLGTLPQTQDIQSEENNNEEERRTSLAGQIWRRRISDVREGRSSVSLETILLSMFEDTIRERGGLSLGYLSQHGPTLFHDVTDYRKPAFLDFVVETISRQSLASIRESLSLTPDNSDMPVANVLQVAFMLYGDDMGYIGRLKPILEASLAWEWQDAGAQEHVRGLIQTIDEHLANDK